MSNTPSVTPVTSSRLEYQPSDLRLRAQAPEPPVAPVAADQVEISDDALALQDEGRGIRTDLVARVRYRLFGRYDRCLLPPPEHRRRFIDV